MKYGILCAMKEEIDLLTQDIVIQKTETIAGRDFYDGLLYGVPVVLVQSRIGKVASASTATTLIDRFGVDQVIFCGTAGGIDPARNVGDIVVADSLVQHDFFSGVDYFRIPLIDVSYFQTDPSLSKEIRAAVEEYVSSSLTADIPQKYLEEFHIHSPKAVTGTIASGDQFINDSEKNQWLRENIRALQCVEMEGAAVAQVCYEFGVPFAVLRVISDSANEASGIDFESFVAEAACYFTRGSIKAFLEKKRS